MTIDHDYVCIFLAAELLPALKQNAPLVEVICLTIRAHDLAVCDMRKHGFSYLVRRGGFFRQPRPKA
jgi:hypothetical protein